MPDFLTLKDLEFSSKRALVRVDFNVPLNKKTGEVSGDKRIKAALPTIKYLIKHKAKVILCSHLGRPKGEIIEILKMDKVAERLSRLLKKPVKKLDDCIGKEVEKAVSEMNEGDVILLENLRFHKEEKNNDKGFSKKLASLADVYVNDAFGTCHRAHASTYGVIEYLKSAAGFLVEKELKVLGTAIENPEKPFVAILGGAKISDKMEVIEAFLKKVDKILIGGAMAFTFFQAQGYEIGTSRTEPECIEYAKKLLKNDRIHLPTDVVVADKFSEDAKSKVVKASEIPKDMMGLDIGPETIESYKEHLRDAKTIIWSGPLGVFEFRKFQNGTKEIAEFLATLDAQTIVGGGDIAAAVEKFKVERKLTHVSTGGGASLEFFEGKELPCIAALERSYYKFK